MSEVIFVVNGEKFSFIKENIPEDSILYDLIFIYNEFNSSETNTYDINEITNNLGDHYNIMRDINNFKVFHDFIVKDIIPNYEDLYILDYFGISELCNYELACITEEHMRKNMYNPKYLTDKEFADEHYGLTKITKKYWENLDVSTDSNKEDLLFNNYKLIKNSWEEVQDNLSMVNNLIDHLNSSPFSALAEKGQNIPGKAFIAGGKIFTSLFKVKNDRPDFDIFLYDCTPKQAEEKIYHLADYLVKNNHFNIKFQRSANAITISGSYNPKNKTDKWMRGYRYEYQIILRLYRSPSEILHGFDVDSCSMGYDGANIWITQRCLYSLMKGYNTVNFNRMSPSYEMRLVKYAIRGMKIYIPNFKLNDVDIEAINKFNEEEGIDNINFYKEIPKIIKLKGIDKLLFLDHQYNNIENYDIRKRMDESPEGINNDYGYSKYGRKNIIYDLLGYLVDSAGIYLEKSAKYGSLIKDFSDKVPFYEGYIYNYNLETGKVISNPGFDMQRMIFQYPPNIENEDELVRGFEINNEAVDIDEQIMREVQRLEIDNRAIEDVNRAIQNELEEDEDNEDINWRDLLIQRNQRLQIRNGNNDDRLFEIENRVIGDEFEEDEDNDVNFNDDTELHYTDSRIPNPLKDEIKLSMLGKSTDVSEEYLNLFKACSLEVNELRHGSSFNTLQFEYISYVNNKIFINLILHFPQEIYDILAHVRPWAFEPNLQFKITNPGEQMTNTFNVTVYEDNNIWYNGHFYKSIDKK